MRATLDLVVGEALKALHSEEVRRSNPHCAAAQVISCVQACRERVEITPYFSREAEAGAWGRGVRPVERRCGRGVYD